MKCVCPMGGDRTCPDDCLLAIWATLSKSDRKTQRKEVAEKLYKQGFPMDQIATQLGVSTQTISTDLSQFSSDLKTQPRASKRGRKGEGRPKGSGRKGTRGNSMPKVEAAREIVRPMLEEGKTVSPHKLEKEHGISHVTFDMAIAAEVGRKEAIVEKTALDPSLLSKTAQEKLDAAMRQHKKKLGSEFEERVHAEVRKRLDEIILPHWKKQIDEAKRLYDRRKGLMDKDTFNTIRRALHPDSRNSISDGKLGAAFNAFMGLEKFLLDEKDSPTIVGSGLPRTWADWEAAKQRATEERRAKRTNSQSTLRPR